MLFESHYSLKDCKTDDFDEISRSFNEDMYLWSHWFPTYDENYKKSINFEEIVKDVQFMSRVSNLNKKSIQEKQGENPPKSSQENEEKKGQTSKTSSSLLSKSQMSRNGLHESKLSASCISLKDEYNDELAISGIFFQKLLWIENGINDVGLEQEYSLEDYAVLFEIIWMNRPLRDMSFMKESLRKKTILELLQKDSSQNEIFENYNLSSIFFISFMLNFLKLPKTDIEMNTLEEQNVQVCRYLTS